jgi:hypothetical protein
VSSKGVAERSSQRARRTRATSICAAAITHAISKRSLPALLPAIARAKAPVSFASVGSACAGRLKPCRMALRAERALPSGVFGPRLAQPFFRLAWRRASLIMPASHAGLVDRLAHYLYLFYLLQVMFMFCSTMNRKGSAREFYLAALPHYGSSVQQSGGPCGRCPAYWETVARPKAARALTEAGLMRAPVAPARLQPRHGADNSSADSAPQTSAWVGWLEVGDTSSHRRRAARDLESASLDFHGTEFT